MKFLTSLAIVTACILFYANSFAGNFEDSLDLDILKQSEQKDDQTKTDYDKAFNNYQEILKMNKPDYGDAGENYDSAMKNYEALLKESDETSILRKRLEANLKRKFDL